MKEYANKETLEKVYNQFLNNKIENLQLLTKQEHRRIHLKDSIHKIKI